MAELQDYVDAAPDVMAIGEFTLAQIENKMGAIPDPPAPSTPPTITKAKIIAIFNTVFDGYSVLKGIQDAGGIGKIAQSVQLWRSQVKLIIVQLAAMKAVYDA